MVCSGVPVVSHGVAVVSRSYPNPVPLVSSMLVPGLWGGWCPVGEAPGGGCGVVGVVEVFEVVCCSVMCTVSSVL